MHPLIEPTLKFLRKDGYEPMATLDIPLVRGFLNLVGSLLHDEYGINPKNTMAIDSLLPLWIAFAYVWSLCASQVRPI